MRLFEHDPVLAQALLRHANSAFYGSAGRCDALHGAIMRVGMQGVETVLVTQMARGMLCRPGMGYGRMVQFVWDHMVSCAPIARELALRIGVDPERAFALGLLHDSGKLVIFDQIAAIRSRVRRELDLPMPVVLQMLHRLHEPIGGMCALRWGLGSEAALAIAHHHRTPPPPKPIAASEVLFLAERIDLAQRNDRRLEAGALWEQGRLTVPMFDAIWWERATPQPHDRAA